MRISSSVDIFGNTVAPAATGSLHCASPPVFASVLPLRFPFITHTLMRSLFLHVSALNDDEYTLFTSSFADIVAPDPPLKPDDDFEKLTVSIREARAWLRGRYPDLPVSDLDQVRFSLSPPPKSFLTTSS
jgi:hypothetical protein